MLKSSMDGHARPNEYGIAATIKRGNSADGDKAEDILHNVI